MKPKNIANWLKTNLNRMAEYLEPEKIRNMIEKLEIIKKEKIRKIKNEKEILKQKVGEKENGQPN